MDEVMIKIWTDESLLYKREYDIAMNMNLDDLYEQILDIADMPSYEVEFQGGMCALVTTGCQYHIRNGDMSSCSMCNLHAQPKLDAFLAVIRKRDVLRYAKIVRELYVRKRGMYQKRVLKDHWLSCCFLGDDQMPVEAYKEFFGKDGVIRKRPLVFEFETSVASISYEKIRQLESFIGNRGLIFRIGVEYGTEWIRNNWINKPVSNNQIMNAIKTCHLMGHKVTANVIVGIPALSEEASLREFIDTMMWLEELKVDYYSISILYRDPKTLQGFIYQNLSQDNQLMKKGLSNGEHTGIPWLFTALRAFEWVIDNIPDFLSRCGLGNFDPDVLRAEAMSAYNYNRNCSCYKEIYNVLRRFAYKKDVQALYSLFESYTKDPCFSSYQSLLEKQEGNAKIEVLDVGKSISRFLWNDQWEYWYDALYNSVVKHPVEERE